MYKRLWALSLFLLLLPAGAVAQYPYEDRSWDPDWNRDYDSQQLRNNARQLSYTAASLWQMIRSQPDYRQPQWSFLYNGMRDFTRNARFYRNDPSDWRARQLVRQAENISRFVARNRLPYEFRNNWFALENQVAFMSRHHGIDFNSGGRRLARTDPFYDERYGTSGTSGMFRWRGRVDGSDIIYLRGNRVDIRHLEARPITNASADVSTPLPGRPMNVELRRLQGRGVVRIVEQPSASNSYAVGVLIEDEEAGADFYEFELVW